MRTVLSLLILTLFLSMLLSLTACSGGSPVDTGATENISQVGRDNSVDSSGNDYIWGYYEFQVSEDHKSMEPIPVRITDMHINARKFLEEAPCSNCLKILGINITPEGYLQANVEIVHPFLALTQYAGFDVRLILIVDGSRLFPETGLVTSRGSLGEAQLINADGYTNLFNTQDFAPGSHGAPLYEYQQGFKANPGTFTSTLNGFVAYKRNSERRVFLPGGSETREVLIDPPTGAFRLGYAVNASWRPPNHIPPTSVPGDFPIQANCNEPYELTATLTEPAIIGNGYAPLQIELRDWQGVSGVESVSVEAPDLHGGLKTATLIDSTTNWGKYEMSLSNEKHAPPGIYDVLVIAKSAINDPNIGPVSAYQIVHVTVVENPLEPIWPMFRHDPRHTGKSEFVGPKTNNVAWKYFTSDYYALHSSPTIGYDGTVHIGGDDKTYYAINPDGTLKWHWVVGQSWVDSSSCIDPYGNMYIVIDGVTSNYGIAYGFDADMNIHWQYQISGWNESSPLIAADGTIVFGSRDHYVYALNDDGTLKWKYLTGGEVLSSPAMDPFGFIYIGSNDNNLYCFDSAGALQWTFTSTGPISTSPAIDLQNRVYFGTTNNKVYCISQSGTEVWSYNTGGQHISSPGIDDAKGVVYIGCDDAKVYALNLSGTLKWTFQTGGVIRTCPAIDSDGYIYIRDRGPGWKVWCISPTGQEVWQKSTESEYNYILSGSPSISNDGSLIVGCSGYAYCFRDL